MKTPKKNNRATKTARRSSSELAPANGSVKKPVAARLYEISAHVNYVSVILATSEKDARAHVATWEHAWDANADLIGVDGVEVIDVRGLKATDWRDEAHDRTPKVIRASSQNDQAQ